MEEVLAEWQPVIDETIAEILPETVDDAHLSEFFGPPTYQYDATAIERTLTEPIWTLLDRGGKRWRAILFVLVVEALDEDPESYLQYAAIPEILHNGTIIVDDVEDEASKRRGGEALHRVCGTDVALNAGNAMYFLPLRIVSQNSGDLSASERLRAFEMLADELNQTHLGQGMDIWWHNQKAVDVDESQYFEMCACKTGCLARIVARLAAIVTGQPESTEQALARYAEEMSIAFQIGDDILDVEHTLDQAGDFGKAFGNDIREGKKTLMVVHAAKEAPAEDATRLEEILWAEENTEEEILEAIDVMQSAGSLDYARETAYDLAASARRRLDDLDLQPDAEQQLREFTRFVIERDK